MIDAMKKSKAKMKRRAHAGLLIFLLCGAARLAAQDLPTEQVDVIKDFNARLIETERYTLQPELPPIDTTVKQQTYDVTAKSLDVLYPPPKIRPIAFRPEENAEVYRGFARLGGGVPNALYAEGNYSFRDDERFHLDLGLNHYSANNTKNVENQRVSTSDFKLDGTYYFDQGFAVNAGAGYSLDNVFFYGYNDFSTADNPISYAKEDVKQRFSTFSLDAELFNHLRTQGDFEYRASLDFYHLQDFYSARENGFDIEVQGTKWIEATHALDIRLELDFSNYRDTSSQNLNNFFLNPSYTYHGDVFKIKAGINLASSDDEFFFFPDVEASLNVIEKVLTAYAGAKGDLYKNNFQNLTNYNPFISSRPVLMNTRYTDIFGGIKGEAFNADYDARISYKRAKDLALFLSNEDTIPRFNVLYDTVDIFTIKGALTMPLFKGLDLTATVAQNIFSPSNEEKAWHLPGLDINVGATYVTMQGKLTLRANLFVQNGVPFKNAEGAAENLNALYDFSAGAEYLFTDKIGFFVQINNILNNKRERWNHYPSFGINGFAGVSARF